MKKAFAEKGAERRDITTWEELGFDFEEGKEEEKGEV